VFVAGQLDTAAAREQPCIIREKIPEETLPLSTSVMEKLKHKESLMTFNDDPGAKKGAGSGSLDLKPRPETGVLNVLYGESDFHF
jgi:hypothetical protein